MIVSNARKVPAGKVEEGDEIRVNVGPNHTWVVVNRVRYFAHTVRFDLWGGLTASADMDDDVLVSVDPVDDTNIPALKAVKA